MQQVIDPAVSRPGVDIPRVDLTPRAMAAHFAATSRRAQLLAFLFRMDRQDHWAVDRDQGDREQAADVQACLVELARVMQDAAPVLHRATRESAEVLAHLTTTRCVYLLRYVAERDLRFLDTLTAAIEQAGPADVSLTTLKRRLEALAQARLLAEVFSAKRLARIVSIMGSYRDG